MPNVPSALLWECVRKSHAFMRKSDNLRTMSAEPGNLMGVHSPAFSGLANTKALGLNSKKVGNKESIVLTQSGTKTSRRMRPKSAFRETGVKKSTKKATAQLEKVMGVAFYRPDLLDLAKVKYDKVRKSFKKPKKATKRFGN